MFIRPSMIALALLVTLVVSPVQSQAPDVPQVFRYTSALPAEQQTGSPHPLRLTARIYANDVGGYPIWVENFSVTPDTDWRVSILLGSENIAGLPSSIFHSNTARWISLQVDGFDESARVPLISVPYALKSRDADMLGGLPASAYLVNPERSLTASDNNSRTTTTGSTTYSSIAPGGVNIVPKFISSSDLGGSQITDTGLGVGLGTSNPQEMLDVQGRALLRSTSRGPAGLWFGTNDATSPFIGLGAADPTSPLRVFHGGIARLTITPEGRIGIGVDAPTTALDVKGDLHLGSGSLYFADGTWLSSATGLGGGVGSVAAADSSIVVSKPSSTILVGVADQGITSPKLADSAVTTPKIADFSITSAKFAPGALSGLGLVGTSANNFVGEQSTQINSATTYAVSAVNSATTNSAVGLYGETASTMGLALKARASSTTGSASAIYAITEASSGNGVFSLANSPTGITYGVYGQSRSISGTGVRGETFTTAGTNYGVWGQTAAGNYSAGVYGIAASTTTSTTQYGVFGRAEGINGIGVVGFAANTAIGGGAPIGVLGQTVSPGGVAGEFVNAAASGNILIARNATGNVWRVDTTGGQWTNGIMHAGGADFAESISPTPSTRQYQPGDLLVIASGGDRQVELSTEAYSTRVIGIYATKPGVLASRHGLDGDGSEIPVAMLGIVPAKASAENGAIHRGDLLVSAATPGFVMRASDRERLIGAIVGKAMQPLDSGTGVIEIAVTLQ
jgi:hypothetical protein